MGNGNIGVNPQWLTLSCFDISRATPIAARLREMQAIMFSVCGQ
jgi:hypothetical protein